MTAKILEAKDIETVEDAVKYLKAQGTTEYWAIERLAKILDTTPDKIKELL